VKSKVLETAEKLRISLPGSLLERAVSTFE